MYGGLPSSFRWKQSLNLNCLFDSFVLRNDEALDVGGDYFFRRPGLLLFAGYCIAAAICHDALSCGARVGQDSEGRVPPSTLNPNFFV